ncbi:MAG: hypothetical protein ACREKL_02635 [Chthoniobacterales bacterium]
METLPGRMMKTSFLRKLSVTIIATWLSISICKAEVLHFYLESDRSTKDVDLELLSHGDAQKAWQLFCEVSRAHYQVLDPNIGDIVQRSGRAIANNTAVQAMLETELKAVPYRTGREYEIPILGDIPSPWSARLLASHLMNPVAIKPAERDSDADELSNGYAAIEGLSAMGFSDAPSKPDHNGLIHLPYDGTGPDQWRRWWKANEANIEVRILEINPDYKPNSKVAGVYAATPAPSVANSTPKPAPAPSATPVVAKPIKRSNWSMYLCGIALAVAVLGATMWALRRKE